MPDGAVDVYARRDADGALTGVERYSQTEFDQHTVHIQEYVHAYTHSITNNVTKRVTDKLSESSTAERLPGESYGEYYGRLYSEKYADYTPDYTETLSKIYQEYEPYDLHYRPEENRLYYNGELVKYFSDLPVGGAGTSNNRYFGPYPDGKVTVAAQRSANGTLTGLVAKDAMEDDGAGVDWRNFTPQWRNVSAASTAPAIKPTSTDVADISVERIPAGQAVCVGKITLDGVSPIVYDVSAASGDKMFVALAQSDSSTDALRKKWWHYISSNSLELAVKATATNSLIQGIYYVYVGTEEKTPLTGVTGRVYQGQEKSGKNKGDAFAESFSTFGTYGLRYDAAKERLYYDDARVKMFISFHSNGSFYLCWSDPDANSGLYLEGLLDGNSRATGIRSLDPGVAAELVEAGVNAISGKPKEPDAVGAAKYLTLDATSIYEADKIVATDKSLTKTSVSENARQRIARCDQQTGTFLLDQSGENGLHTYYLYYNGGGRYPWNLAVSGNAITCNLYTRESSANRGYHLMKLDTDGAWSIAAVLDGLPLQFKG